MTALLSVAALLFSGGVQALISPPLGWTFLHPFSWAPAFWVFSRLNWRRALLAGWLVGASANVAIFYWLVGTLGRFSNLPYPVAILALAVFALVTGFYVAVFAAGFGAVRRRSGRWWPFSIAAWFTAVEFLNPQLFAYFQGVAWYRLPSVFLVTTLTGVSGITFLVVLCSGVVLQIAEAVWGGKARPSTRACLVNAAVLLGLLGFASVWSVARLAEIARAESKAESIRVALVQPNYDVERRRAMARMEPGIFAKDLIALSREASRRDEGIDVFVWPEGVLTGPPGAPHNRDVLDFVRETGAEVWTGADSAMRAADGRFVFYNSAFRVFGDGEVDERYDKSILVPFGEYMPLKKVFPLLAKIQGPGDFARGRGLHIYEATFGRFAFLICYEAIQADYVREGARRGLDLLVNLTQDAWYGDTSEPSQHLMLAAIQAAQYGVPLVRATTTGISAFVDARGRITAESGVFTREVLVRDVKTVRVPSVYSRAGDWFPWGCVFASAALLAAGPRRRRSRSTR